VLLKVVGPNPEAAPEAPAATDVRLNRKGDSALVLLDRELWLIPVPRVGGTPTVDLGKPGVASRRLTLVGADSFEWTEQGDEIHWSLGAAIFRVRKDAVAMKTGEAATKANDIPLQQANVTVEVRRAKPSGTIVLRGVNAITMRGDEVIPNADIVVTDNRIAAIGKRGNVSIPRGAVIKNLEGENSDARFDRRSRALDGKSGAGCWT
jgi:hypothetical protein